MFKLAQTDRPTDRPIDRAKTILYLRKIHNHIKKFHHGDWTINATESVNIKKAPPLGGHVFHDIIETLYRVLKRFFESRTIAPTDNRSYAKFDKADSRSYDVLTGRTERPSALSNLASNCPDSRKNAPPPGAHVFEPTGTIFELAQDIILTNLLTKFHDDGQ
ncbi:hypothetical protein DPMN_169229 [Dreissena polymorpha]|uniref:Uncharacterized protein n=1 Tax=Dreissena polymorpha TaxID=45954 RepID=A0A9D4F264_DREPO|nr:hypothetical protein DPMN_169229 [Dreissena polymorpha]